MKWFAARLLLASSVLLLGSSVAARAWTLDKQEEGIDVYTRTVEGSGIKEFRGIAEIAADVDAVMGILRDSDRFKDWYPNTAESRLLSREGTVTYQYSVMSTPWPIADRDNVFRSVTARDDMTGVVDIDVSAAPDYYPAQDGRVRVREAKGSWKLEPRGPEKTRVTFTMHLDPGGGIPKWMINARVVESPFEALRNLRAAAAK